MPLDTGDCSSRHMSEHVAYYNSMSGPPGAGSGGVDVGCGDTQSWEATVTGMDPSGAGSESRLSSHFQGPGTPPAAIFDSFHLAREMLDLSPIMGIIRCVRPRDLSVFPQPQSAESPILWGGEQEILFSKPKFTLFSVGPGVFYPGKNLRDGSLHRGGHDLLLTSAVSVCVPE